MSASCALQRGLRPPAGLHPHPPPRHSPFHSSPPAACLSRTAQHRTAAQHARVPVKVDGLTQQQSVASNAASLASCQVRCWPAVSGQHDQALSTVPMLPMNGRLRRHHMPAYKAQQLRPYLVGLPCPAACARACGDHHHCHRLLPSCVPAPQLVAPPHATAVQGGAETSSVQQRQRV